MVIINTKGYGIVGGSFITITIATWKVVLWVLGREKNAWKSLTCYQ